MKSSLLLFASLVVLSSASGQEKRAGTDDNQRQLASKSIRTCEKDVVWKDAPPPLAPGAKVAVIEGNPNEKGYITFRMKFPPYYKVPPHVHPVEERTTVISGAMSIGIGEVMDTLSAVRYNPGCFYMNPVGLKHYAFTSELETVIQISTMGPWGLTFLNEVDAHPHGK